MKELHLCTSIHVIDTRVIISVWVFKFPIYSSQLTKELWDNYLCLDLIVC